LRTRLSRRDRATGRQLRAFDHPDLTSSGKAHIVQGDLARPAFLDDTNAKSRVKALGERFFSHCPGKAFTQCEVPHRKGRSWADLAGGRLERFLGSFCPRLGYSNFSNAEAARLLPTDGRRNGAPRDGQRTVLLDADIGTIADEMIATDSGTALS